MTKMNSTKLIVLLTFAFPFIGSAQNAYPEILSTNMIFNEEETTFTINYTFADADNTEHEVDLLVSVDGGKEYNSALSDATGDIGTLTDQNGEKTIVYDHGSADISQTIVRLVITDNELVDIQSIVDAVDSTSMKNFLFEVEGIRHRTADLPHLEEVRQLIKDEHESHGLDIEITEFEYQSFTAQNIVASSSGTNNPTEKYFIGGHYDSVNNSPGADDNGTAMAAMLEAARVLSGYNFNKSISYVAWDLEEPGLKGSIDYVTNHIPEPSNIKGYLNFEMIGYYDNAPNTQSLPTGFQQLFPDAFDEIFADEFRGNFLTNVGNVDNSTGIMNDFETIAGTYVPELNVISIASPGDGSLVPDLLRSDHAPFWVADIPAVMLTDGADFRNPYYHSMDDTSDKLNFNFMMQNVKAAVAYLAEKAEVNHSVAKNIAIDSIISNQWIEHVNFQLKIYPNPAMDVIFVDAQDFQSNSNKVYRIYNNLGQMLIEGEHNFTTQGLLKVDLVNLNIGSYYFYIADNNGKSSRKRFLIN